MRSVPKPTQKSSYLIPASVAQKLSDLRGLISRYVVTQSLLLIAIWLVVAFWIFGVIDYVPARLGAAESPHAVRVIMLTLMIGFAVYLLYRFLWQLWRVRWSDSSLALLIENKHPEFQSSLITTVQAASPSSLSDLSQEEHPQRAGLLRLACDRATELMERVDLNGLIHFRPLQTQLIVLGSLLGMSCVAALSQPTWTYHWAKRFFALSDVPWPRSTELGLEGIELDVPTFTGRNSRQRYLLPFIEGAASVPKGQSCQLKSWAMLTGKIVPEVCTVYYRDSSGNRGRANMRRLTATKQQQSFVLDGPPLESVNDSLWLSIAGGDARISNLQLKSVEAPLVTKLDLNVTYPEYLQRSTKTVWGKETIEYRTGTRLPQGSQVSFVLQTNKQVKRCDYVVLRSGDSQESKEAQEKTVELDAPASSFQLPIGSLDGNVLMELRLWDAEGICSSRIQQFVVSAINDQAPQVELVLQGIGTAITENAVLPLSAKIKDDYELQSAWVETVLNEKPMQRTDVAVQPDGTAQSRIDLKAMRDEGQWNTTVGSTLVMTMAARDYLDLNAEPHVGRGNPIPLTVVTPDQLLIMLERRELAMRARLEQIIGELSQLRDLLINMQKAAQLQNTAGVSESKKEIENDDPQDASETAESRQARLERTQILRSQQAAAQLSKSEGELRGVEKEIHQINQELINNRVDSEDRRTRLEDKIRKPMLQVLENDWPPMSAKTTAIEKGLSQNAKDTNLGQWITEAIAKDNEIISKLTDILNDMVNIQDFNELLDMTRAILDDQNKVLEKTKQEQKKQLLDLLK